MPLVVVANEDPKTLTWKCRGGADCLRWTERDKVRWSSPGGAGPVENHCNWCGMDQHFSRRIWTGGTPWTRSGPAHTKDIFASADRGCQTCQLLKAGLQQYRAQFEMTDDDFEHPDIMTEVQQTEIRDGGKIFIFTIIFAYGGPHFDEPLRREFEFESSQGIFILLNLI